MDKPFWEQTYRDGSVSTFTKDPTADIAEYWTLFPAGGTVLDVGCGEGRNSPAALTKPAPAPYSCCSRSFSAPEKS